ncbi:hypothetical protein OsccyDRAFT_2166 [Leptolyngbyaceae cyanobacterium JSC-12]|nr:hypothetical protein OsccyDRAFT_2166 [Leptolyngbyaceae cyanobacterium JSC-12]
MPYAVNCIGYLSPVIANVSCLPSVRGCRFWKIWKTMDEGRALSQQRSERLGRSVLQLTQQCSGLTGTAGAEFKLLCNR